jgi:multimeric flavodoxin WrbA
MLAEAVLEGVVEAGNESQLVQLSGVVTGLMRDCRKCRGSDGRCSIDDGYRDLLLERVIPADALVIATPLYWYGVSSHFKAFLDRIFCYIADSAPESERVNSAIGGKRIALCISCEESYEGSRLGVLNQFRELERYLDWSLTGVVAGVGNSRGEVARDPEKPLHAARELGRNLFQIRRTDYTLLSDRPGSVWPQQH